MKQNIVKKIILTLLLLIPIVSYAQNNACEVVFSKFKLEWFNVMGMRGGGNGQRLKLTFKNNSDKVLKYVNVHYWAINAVNDIETDQFGRKDFSVNCTGPFDPESRSKLEVQIALFHPNLLIAYPYKIEITYMNGEEREIEIDKNNINTIFPCVKYISVGKTGMEKVNEKDIGIQDMDSLGQIDDVKCRIAKKYNNGMTICTSKELTPDQIRKAVDIFSLKGKIMFNMEGSEGKGESYAGIDDGFIIIYKNNEFIKL